MLLRELSLQFKRFLVELLAPLQGFLLKLLPACRELLFELRQLGLHVVLHLS